MDWVALSRERLAGCAELPLVTQAWAPRAPRSVAELSALTRQTKLTSEHLRLLIERDPELTSQVLKQVNSCTTGLKSRIRTVPRAIGLLGERRCQMLVLSAMLQASLRLTRVDPTQLDGFLGDCLERALFAQLTAEALRLDAECAYVGALLQDLLLPHLRNTYAADYAAYAGADAGLAEFERRTFGWDHAALTARVLKSWNLPEEVVCCVLLSHAFEDVIEDGELLRSPLVASLAGALLPDSFHQEPFGIARLIQLQESLPEFDFLQIALQVDEELEPLQLAGSRREPLCDRLSRLAVCQVEEARKEIVWTHQRIGNYVLERQLGQGGMGVVFLAQHTTLRRTAAIKLMKHQHLDAEALERFETEARLTSGLQSPHTIEIYDYGATSHGMLYYVMEYLRGLSLNELVQQFGPQPQARVVHILRQVCDSLQEAHALGLIHRDIKPENIFLSTDERSRDFVKVLDFGLVKSIQSAASGEGGKPPVCGTPLFLAPEAILAPDTVDGRTDLYALGLVAYYMLCGELAITGEDSRSALLAQISTTPVPPSQRSAMPIDPQLEALVMQCLEKLPADRPPSAASVASRLSQLHQIPTWTPEAAHEWWLRNASPAPSVTETAQISASRTAVMGSELAELHV